MAKKGEIEWTRYCEEAFLKLKGKLTNNPILYALDFNREFVVQTDSSEVGLKIVLAQTNDQDKQNSILFISKKFSKTEQRYSTT